MEDTELIKQKLDPILQSLVENEDDQVLPLIIQTLDGLKDEDRQVVQSLGGKVKDDLYIINAFSADLPSKALSSLVLSPRITRVYYDAHVEAIQNNEYSLSGALS
ncbi:MAG: hypothetical protein M1269_02065 [Chloroflexi bacterium]|nr:hypothetical protein [Chloroflexota bacterium]